MSQANTRDEIIETLASVKHIGRARAALLYDQLGVDSVEALVDAATEHRLQTLNGIGGKTERAIERAARALLTRRQTMEAARQRVQHIQTSLAETDDVAMDDGATTEAPAEAPVAEETTEASVTEEATDEAAAPDEAEAVEEVTEGVEVVDEAEVIDEAPDKAAATEAIEATREEDTAGVKVVERPTLDERPAPATARGATPTRRTPETDRVARVTPTPEVPTTGATRGPIAPIQRFIGSLICPNCGNDTFGHASAGVQCDACERVYTLSGGALDMLHESTRAHSLSQKLMESRLVSSVYERAWRPNMTRLVSNRSMEREHELAVELMALQADSRVLDVACGTGSFTRAFAEALDAQTGDAPAAYLLVGMDRSAPMLERAQEYASEANLQKRTFFLRADAERLPMQRGAFDRVHCAAALQLMQDPAEALRNIARVLEPGGRLVLSTFLRSGGRLERTLKRMARPAGFRWFTPGDLHTLLTEAGFDVEIEHRDGDAITIAARRRGLME